MATMTEKDWEEFEARRAAQWAKFDCFDANGEIKQPGFNNYVAWLTAENARVDAEAAAWKPESAAPPRPSTPLHRKLAERERVLKLVSSVPN